MPLGLDLHGRRVAGRRCVARTDRRGHGTRASSSCPYGYLPAVTCVRRKCANNVAEGATAETAIWPAAKNHIRRCAAALVAKADVEGDILPNLGGAWYGQNDNEELRLWRWRWRIGWRVRRHVRWRIGWRVRRYRGISWGRRACRRIGWCIGRCRRRRISCCRRRRIGWCVGRRWRAC